MIDFNTYCNFKLNKYYQWYSALMNKVSKLNRSYDSDFHESHHILPKSFGGSDNAANRLNLTPREHYVAHRLLCKFTIGKDKRNMTFALHTFFHFGAHRKCVAQGRAYAAHKKMFIAACKERICVGKSEKFHFKHRKTGDEFFGTRIEFRDYSGISEQEIYNILAGGSRHSKDWGVLDRLSGKFSYERIKLPHILKDKKCEICFETMSPGNYGRWHGKNCNSIKCEHCGKIISKRAYLVNHNTDKRNGLIKCLNKAS